MKALCGRAAVSAPVFVLCAVVFTSCYLLKGRNGGQPCVARVGNECLTRLELDAMMPQVMGPADSAETARKRIAAWVSSRVLLQKAQENLDEDIYAQIERQIENYRESLLVFYYENRITERLLDTVVSDNEIREYYEENRNQFVLKSNIVRLNFVKAAKSGKHAGSLRRGLFDTDLSEGSALYEYGEQCRKYAENYFLDASQWLYFNDVLREIPLKTYNQEEFLKNHRNVEVESGDYMYFVRILDFRVRDMVSPLEFERERIKSIILNGRKKALLDGMERDLMENARQSGLVEYYVTMENEADSI